ncbi:MAG: extracellular solute-binding protein [Verrucomicrobia bacterium]|nr:extracellular solute-binding protein [Verrucomicrobiota bacterium]
MKARASIIIGLLALIVALPLVMRRQSSTGSAGGADDCLVILSPHNETIRQEVGEAFAGYWKQRSGRRVYLDWRTPGGTSEIRMVLEAGFKAARETGREGIGMDVLFGGGEPDFSGQAKQGRLVPLQVFKSHPEWFGPTGPIMETFSGERFYPPDHVWVGTCLSQFGICYNPEVLKRLHLPCPTRWDDLGDPRYVGTIALADPTKSGSVARSFELLIQDQMQRALAKPGQGRDAALAAGWDSGLRLIQRMAANARYFTDSSSKIPQDVGQGNAAAGMCIDLYGRSYAAELRTREGTPRVVWLAPQGGTTLSADPIGVLKGAPHPELAQAFVEFCLSAQGQTLWFGKPGTPGGPRDRALHRTPIRTDTYTAAKLANSTLPGLAPFTDSGNFTYQRELTGAAFNTLRQLVKIICIDSHEEMKSAWRALIAAGMPADALAVFGEVSILPYATCGKGDADLDSSDPLRAEARAAALGTWFRANYRKAEAMATEAAVHDRRRP